MDKYKVKVKVTGKNLDNSIGSLKEQVSLRPDLEESDVYVDDSDELVIKAIVSGYSEEEVSKLVSEQIWELLSAVLKDLNSTDVEVESVEKVK